MTATTSHPRPWYCNDRWVDEYCHVLTEGKDPKMIRCTTIFRATVVNVGVIGITLYSLSLGADPTIVPSVALVTLGLYNGVELADYAALVQALAEVPQQAQDQSDNPPPDDDDQS